MNQMTLAPDQRETEKLLRDALSHGDMTSIANILEVSPSEISQQCNPDDPYKSSVYKFKRFLWALSAVNKKAAKLIGQDISSSVQLWTGEPLNSRSVEALTSELAQEVTNLVRARLESKPDHVLRREALEIRVAVDKFLEALGEDKPLELKLAAASN